MESPNIKIRPDLGPLMIGLILAALIIGSAIVEMKKSGDTITVTGSAKRPITSDLIVWKGSVATQLPQLNDAYDEIKMRGAQFRKFLTDNGVQDGEITFGALITEVVEEYEYEEGGKMFRSRGAGRVAGYRLKQPFEVRSTRLNVIDSTIVNSGDLAKDKLILWASAPEYLYTKLADLRIEMLGQATKDATERARVMAESSGSSIGDLRSARMGVFQITPRNSTDVSDYGYYDTSSKEKDITAVVTVSFSLKSGFPLFNLF